jgi:hypothetical protein
MRGIITKAIDEEQRIVYGEVYRPLDIDTDMEAMTPEAVRKAAHDFIKSGKIDHIDVCHNYEKTGCKVVESYIVKANDPDGFIEGSWVMGVWIPEDDLWQDVKSGKINCFSFGGASKKIPAQVTILSYDSLAGETEKNADGLVPEHTHQVSISFDSEGNIIPTETTYVLGHSHKIVARTATEMEAAHAHRMIIEEE